MLYPVLVRLSEVGIGCFPLERDIGGICRSVAGPMRVSVGACLVVVPFLFCSTCAAGLVLVLNVV